MNDVDPEISLVGSALVFLSFFTTLEDDFLLTAGAGSVLLVSSPLSVDDR